MAYTRYSIYAVARKNRGLGQYGAEPHYSTLPFWQICALNGEVVAALNLTT